MGAGAPPSSPDPLSSRVVPPSDPVAMPSPPVVPPSDLVAMPSPPPPAPPAAAEDEERPWPPMKMKLFPYAMYCVFVFGGMGRTGENLLVAFVGIHYLNIIANLFSFHTNGDQARFWTLVSSVMLCLCFASTTLITCVFIRYYMRVDGEYHVTFDPPQQHLAPAAAAEAEQLPPPPPEMDMY